MTAPTHRVRAKKPKSKTGCQTCRTRRIKCDESIPACQRCISAGWVCDGYPGPSTVGQNSACETVVLRTSASELEYVKVQLRPWYLPLFRLNPQDGQAFTFFRHHTTTQFHNGLETQLWNGWAMQISHHEPAILHAMIAVGSLHCMLSGQIHRSPRSGSPTPQLALSHYAKAVVELRSRLEQPCKPPGLDVVLLACLLFIGFEMLQHEIPVAMEHLQMGLRIMRQKTNRKPKSRCLKDSAMGFESSADAPLNDLVPIFVRLDYAAPMFGKRHPLIDLAKNAYSLDYTPSIPSTFDSLAQARSCLDTLANGVFRLRGDLLKFAENRAIFCGTLPSDAAQRQCHLFALSRSVDLGPGWQQVLARKTTLEAGMCVFWRALENIADTLETSSMNRAHMAVQIQYFSIYFTITTCRDTHELMCDTFNDLFETTIQTVERYFRSALSHQDSTQKRAFSLELGVIPTIHLVAQRCRKPELRARATSLLQEGCMQEAMWDGMPFAMFMQKLADLEEAASIDRIDSYDAADAVMAIDGQKSVVVPEHARFIDVVIDDGLDELGRGRFVCARYRHESSGHIELSEYNLAFDGT